MKTDRIILDTNVLISHAILTNSKTGQLARFFFETATILYSADSLAELTTVLYRPKFDRYITNKERKAYISWFVTTGHKVSITEFVSVCRDPDDDVFLELALNGEAHLIVSGDSDLLVLNPFQGIGIISPKEATLKFL